MRFHVIDKKTGKEPDLREIALNEEWAKKLCYCDMEGFAIEDDGTLILLDECGAYAYCPSDRFAVVFESEPFERGRSDCFQDRCENVPFSSIGGLDKRDEMVAPDYITKHGEDYTKEYLDGYRYAAERMFGPDWRTCTFGWKPVMEIGPDGVKVIGGQDGQHGGDKQAPKPGA